MIKRSDLKSIIEGLMFIETVSSNMLDSAILDIPDDDCEALGREHDSITHVLNSIARTLHSSFPEIPDICAECSREALERGRVWSEQRAEQLQLLRLAGDETPEEQVPFGPFGPRKGGAA